MSLTRYLVQAFEAYYPNEYDRCKEYSDVDPGLIRIRLVDGTTGYFDNIDFVFRVVYRHGDDFTEAWKKAFAVLLDYRMTMKCISQARLSEITGISQASLSGYLNGKKMPTALSVAKIAKAVDVPSQFFTDCLLDIL